MGVSIFYSGKLADGKSIDEVVSYVEAIATKEKLRCQRPEEFGDETHRFQIPQKVIDNPDAVHWAYQNRQRITKYAQEARLPIEGRSYQDLCHALNCAEFTQVGVYLWVHEQAEPLRFLFVEGNTELTELKSDSLQETSSKMAKPIEYVHFQRGSLATNTAYEHDPNAHYKALEILQEVNELYFGGRMMILNPS